jgi:hypothetical protein
MEAIQFSKEDKKQFYADLRKRVNQYFDKNKISKDSQFQTFPMPSLPKVLRIKLDEL